MRFFAEDRRYRAGPIIGVLAIASLIVWSVGSHAVKLWREQAPFLVFVLRSFWAKPVVHAVPFAVPTDGESIVAALIGGIACVAAGWYVARRTRGTPFATPMGWIAGIGVAVIPPTLVALVRWPDGQGGLSSTMIAASQSLMALLTITVSARMTGGAANRREEPEARAERSREDAAVAGRFLPQPWLVWPVVGLAALYWLTVLAAGASGLQGYDSFSDHIARPARWLVTQRLETGVDGEVVTYYPGNFELLVRWLLTFGSDRLAFVASYASSIAALWVIYRLAREIGQSAVAAGLSTLAAASLPVLAYQSVVVYSDTFTALCLLLATWVLLLWVREGATDTRASLAFGAALGLAMGAKYSAGPPAVVLTVIWGWYASRGRERASSNDDFEQPLIDMRALTRQGVWYVAGVIPGMAFWYLRNAVREGNPLYPLSVAGLPGIPLDNLLAGAPGPRTLWERLAYPWIETGYLAGFETGLGATVAALVVPAVLLAPWTGPGSPRERHLHRLLLVVLAVALLAWLRTGVLVPRYGLFPLLLSCVFAGSLLSAFPSRILQGTAVVAMAGTMMAVGFELAGGAAYNMLFHDARPPVPAEIATLPPSRILNLAGQPSGYYAMGADYRHRVLTPFGHLTPEQVARRGADYVLVLESEEAVYAQTLPMQLVARWSRPNWPSTSLWRLE